MVAALSSPVRALQITGTRHGDPVTRPVTLVLPNRNPENSDRSRGLANGGTPSGNIGFSRELTPDQRRLVVESQRIDVRVLEQAPAVLRAARTGAAADAGFALTYGSDGRFAMVAPKVMEQGVEKVATPAGRPVGQAGGDAAEPRSAVGNPAATTPPAIDRPVAASAPERSQQRQAPASPTTAAESVREAAAREVSALAGTTDAADALARERLANAYRTVPQATSLNVSLFA